MKIVVLSIFAIPLLAASSFAADPPSAPSTISWKDGSTIEPAPPVSAFIPKPTQNFGTEHKIFDGKFLSLAVVSTGSTFSDSYTTVFARQNWLAGKKGVCNMEVESAYLYGTHPTVGRAYAVASAKSAVSVAAAYYLRKHHNRFWSLPLIGNSIISLQGVTQNMMTCN